MAQKRDGLYKRGPVWWIRTDPVTGKAQSTYCRDLEAARRYRAVSERLAADPSHAAAETARLDEWIRRVIAVKESDGSSKSTVEVYRTKLGHWLRLAPGAMLADITPDFVDAFVAQRRTEEVTDHTISKEVTHLCTVLKAAKRAGCYSLAIETLRPPGLHAGYKPRKRALTREEVVALMAELKPELAALVAICVSLGCRLSEAYRLQPTDVGAASVHIRGTKTDEADRYVPILSIFKSLLVRGAAQLPLGREPNNLRRDMAACLRSGPGSQLHTERPPPNTRDPARGGRRGSRRYSSATWPHDDAPRRYRLRPANHRSPRRARRSEATDRCTATRTRH
jgi:integrase